MKKAILTFILILSATFAFSQAQTVNLTLTLSDVLSFTVDGTPSITFDTEEKYGSGANATIDDHISVVSNRNYQVTVLAGTFTNNPSTLTVSSIKITASQGTYGGNYTGVSTYPTLTLNSTTAQNLIVSTKGSFTASDTKTKYKVKYEAGLNKEYVDKATGVNIIPITYSISQP